MLRMAEALERIQQAAGAVIPVPEAWSEQDALNVGFYDALLRDGSAVYPTPARTPVQLPLEEVKRLLGQGPLPRLRMEGRQGDRNPTLLGVELLLPERFGFETVNLLIANPLELARQAEVGDAAQPLMVDVVADGRTQTVFRLGPAG